MTYKGHLKKDIKLASLLAADTHALKKRKNTPIRLIASIISQQLSTKVELENIHNKVKPML